MELYQFKHRPLERCRRVRAVAHDVISKDHIAHAMAQTRVFRNRLNHYIRYEWDTRKAELDQQLIKAKMMARGQSTKNLKPVRTTQRPFLAIESIDGIYRSFMKSRDKATCHFPHSVWQNTLDSLMDKFRCRYTQVERFIIPMRAKHHEQELALNADDFTITRKSKQTFVVNIPAMQIQVHYKLKGRIPRDITRIRLLLDEAGLDIVVYYTITPNEANPSFVHNQTPNVVGMDVGMRETLICSDNFRMRGDVFASRMQHEHHLDIRRNQLVQYLKRTRLTADTRKTLQIERKQLCRQINRYKRIRKYYAKSQRNSEQWLKWRKCLRYVDKHYRRRLRTFLGQFRYKLIHHVDLLCIEDLGKKMIDKHHSPTTVGKHWYRAGYKDLNTMLLELICTRQLIVAKTSIDFPSTAICSCCRHRTIANISPEVKAWQCPKCGTNHDRDINAATNLYNAGIAFLRSMGSNYQLPPVGVKYAIDKEILLSNPNVWINQVQYDMDKQGRLIYR